MEKLDSELLGIVAGIHDIPRGAYNIRKNGKLLSRKVVEGIDIQTKSDKPGIDIKVSSFIKGESVHIPVIVTEGDLHDLVYNDFYIESGADVVIVAGCGLHSVEDNGNSHDGIHEFWLQENAKVKYIENHYAQGKRTTDKVLKPKTIIHLAPNSQFIMETAQLGGVTYTDRQTFADIGENAVLQVNESILTTDDQRAITKFEVELNGANSKVTVVSRSVAKNNSNQSFTSIVNGNNECFGHVECDAIIFDNASVSSTPALKNTNVDALLTHEAAIGKISGEQLIKLQTLGLTKEEAEQAILQGFLRA